MVSTVSPELRQDTSPKRDNPRAGIRRRIAIALVISTAVTEAAFFLPAFGSGSTPVTEVLSANDLSILPIPVAAMLIAAILTVLTRARWLAIITGIAGIIVNLGVLMGLLLVSGSASALGNGFLELWGLGWWLVAVGAIISMVLSIVLLTRRRLRNG